MGNIGPEYNLYKTKTELTNWVTELTKSLKPHLLVVELQKWLFTYVKGNTIHYSFESWIELILITILFISCNKHNPVFDLIWFISPVVDITTPIYYGKVRILNNCIIVSSEPVKQHLIFKLMVITDWKKNTENRSPNLERIMVYQSAQTV